jgi:hypothetical protein
MFLFTDFAERRSRQRIVDDEQIQNACDHRVDPSQVPRLAVIALQFLNLFRARLALERTEDRAGVLCGIIGEVLNQRRPRRHPDEELTGKLLSRPDITGNVAQSRTAIFDDRQIHILHATQPHAVKEQRVQTDEKDDSLGRSTSINLSETGQQIAEKGRRKIVTLRWGSP